MKEKNNESVVLLKVHELEVIIGDAVKNSIELSKKSVHEEEKNEELIARKDLARELMISLPTLRKYTVQGIVPKPVKIGGKIMYRRSEVESFKKS